MALSLRVKGLAAPLERLHFRFYRLDEAAMVRLGACDQRASSPPNLPLKVFVYYTGFLTTC